MSQHINSAPVIVFLNHVARLSGAELALLRTVTAMRRYKPVVLLAEEGPLVGALMGHGVTVDVIPLAARTVEFSRNSNFAGTHALNGARDVWRYSRTVASALSVYAPALIHTNSSKAHIYGSIVARLVGLPLVCHVRDRVSKDFMSGPGVVLLKGALATMPSGVIANSKSTLDTVPRGRVRRRVVLPSPVSAPAAEHADRQRPADDPIVFGLVGRLTPWKGQDLAIRALAAAFPGGNEQLVLVGAALFGEDAYVAHLHDLARSLGLRDRVRFRGHVDDVYREMSTFSALLHTSIIPEPFGQVIAQGMAVGLAVIAANEGGPTETIENGRTGLLYQPRSVSALASAMRRVGSDVDLRTRLGREASKVAPQFFPVPVTARLEQFYDSVLSR